MRTEHTSEHARPRHAHFAHAAAALGCLALALAATLASPAPALASDQTVTQLREALERAISDPSYSPYSSPDGAMALADNTYAEKFDLRSQGTVTSVKRQNPWGSCWAFASISAAETSILNSGAASGDLDLSERQVAWFTYTAVTEDQVGEAQAGEGYHTDGTDPNAVFDIGGQIAYATSLFSSGCGPISEDEAPYQNDEGYISCVVSKAGEDETEEKSLTEDEIEKLEAQGYTVTRSCYSKTLGDGTTPATWSLGSDLRNKSEYTLKESYILPDTRILDSDGDWAGLSQEGVNAVKNQLTQGRAVTVSFHADTSKPEDEDSHKYINPNTWAHFTYDDINANHAVTIVGWDDTYSKDNFLSNFHQPEGDGAWLVKNSWGAETEDFPNYKDDWGLTDEDGNHTGYFWISYYDRSLQRYETFDFEATTDGESDGIDQYDYLPRVKSYALADQNKWSSANVFTATEDRTLTAVSCMTTVPSTAVTYEIYLLDADTENPEDGTLARTVTADYEYGGYHRRTLSEGEQLSMRAGQRYAVVVTQQCKTDGFYYVNASLNARQLTEDELKSYREQLDSYYQLTYLDVFRRNKYQALLDEGKSTEEAKAEALAYVLQYLQTDEWASFYAETVLPKVEEGVRNAQNGHYESKVNEGESWLYTSDENSGAWSDWAALIPETGLTGRGYVADNFSIKAFYTTKDWASVESLTGLSSKVEAGQAALAAARVSTDGTDVEPGKTWLTQTERDKYVAALDAARKQLAAAGDKYATSPAATTPSQADVDASIAALDTSVFKPGTKSQDKGKDDEEDDGDHSGDGSGDEHEGSGDEDDHSGTEDGGNEGDGGKGNEQPGDGGKGGKGTDQPQSLPQTGDLVTVAPLAGALVSGVAALATGLRRRR